MSFPHADVLHGDPCDCTLHDLGLNCRWKITAESLPGTLNEVVVSALRSGIHPDDLVEAFKLVVEWHRALEVKQ